MVEAMRRRSKMELMNELKLSPRELGRALRQVSVEQRPDGAVDQAEFEAIHNLVMPFRIVPEHRMSETLSPDTLKDLLSKEGGVEVPEGVHLQFRTRTEAKDALERLVKATGSGHWTIVEVKD